MSRHPALLPWTLWGLTAVATVAGVALAVIAGADLRALAVDWVLASALMATAFATVGALVASHHRRNPVGWPFLQAPKGTRR